MKKRTRPTFSPEFRLEASQFPDDKLTFFLGAIAASYFFLFLLGYGARYLQPLFHSAKAWKILDVGIGVLMISIAFSLVS